MLSEKVFKSGYDVTSKSKLAGGEKNDCFVRACSNAFDVSYESAHEFVAERFDRKNGKGTRMCNLRMKDLQNEVIEFQKGKVTPRFKKSLLIPLPIINNPIPKKKKASA